MRRTLTPLKDSNHVLHLIGIGVLPTKSLRRQHLVLPHSLIPIQVCVLILFAPLLAASLLHSAEAKTSCETMAAAVLGRHGSLQRATPFQALFAVIGNAVVYGHVHFHHAGPGLEAQLRGRRTGKLVGTVGVLQDQKTAAVGEGWVDEDIVGGGDGVVLLVLDSRLYGISIGHNIHLVDVVHIGKLAVPQSMSTDGGSCESDARLDLMVGSIGRNFPEALILSRLHSML
jgi:hypothetical protein